MARVRLVWRTLIGVAALVTPVGLQAQLSCVGIPQASGRWSAPLDRSAVLDGEVRPIRDVLEQIARTSGVHLTYATDLIPDQLVCGGRVRVVLGDAIAVWLGNGRVQAVVVGTDRVVLVPARVAVVDTDVSRDLALGAAVLTPVIVRDSVRPGVLPVSTVSRTVISGAQLVASGATTLSAALSAEVPGLWMWTPTPTSLGSGIASLRGASSFGANYPKVYIDGVEVANSLFLGHLSPDQVEQVEVIRGPQGSALHGAGAISGVINITTRQARGGTESSSGMSMRTSAGLSESAFSPLGSLVQDHAFSGEFGSRERRMGLGLSRATTGAFIPGAFSRQWQGSAGFSTVGARHRLQLTARMFGQEAGNPDSPLLPELPQFSSQSNHVAPMAGQPARAPIAMFDTSASQSVREYTLGGTVSLDQARWVHTFVAGIDGYRLNNVSPLPASLRTPADSALLAASGAADRGSLRWNGVTRRGHIDGVSATFTIGADQSALRDASLGATPPGTTADGGALWRYTTGVMGHAEVGIRHFLVLTGGLRAEHNAGYTVLSGGSVLPTVGAAWRRSLSPSTLLTIRGAYGRAIQPPRVGSYALRSGGRIPSVLALEPEEQAGFEVGADLRVGSRLAFSLVRYDQEARNLIQPVAFSVGGPGRSTVVTRHENVGAIANKGWELEGRYAVGALTLTTAMGLTDSRVRQVAEGYTGELRAGDRVLQVPARTLSVGATWLGRGWSSSMTLARASDWMNYNWLELSVQPQLTGASLRDFWMQYPGVTRMRASFSRDITRTIGLSVSGDNLLNRQRGEPDNLTIVPGRTLRAGFRARFL